MKKSNLVVLDDKTGFSTIKDLPVDTVLDKAKEFLDKSQHVLVIGYDKENILYEASSTSDLKEIIFLLEKCRRNMVERSFEEEEDA